ncbi:hypothetical protein AB0Q95_30465 [Streptomyces sp. NPDC059900]|uniref:hypothetical protein n=1 Tax=Streptomyces sp. NPDC059900 TaxID=3155816 RepID=UPI0034127FD7
MPVQNTALRRATARITLPVILAAAAITLTPTPASAAEGGDLENRSSVEMEYASFSGGGRVHRCQVWNDTLTARWADSENLACKQSALPASREVVGRYDVDGFTFEDRAYVVFLQMPDLSYLQVQVGKGVWTKITNADRAVCSGSAKPQCVVTIF